MKIIKTLGLCLLLTIFVTPASSQTPDNTGAELFDRVCAVCHIPEAATAGLPSANGRAPTFEMLQGLAPNAIVTSLTSGKMIIQGEPLQNAERVAVAEFVTGRSVADSVASNSGFNSQCTTTPLLANSIGLPSWNGWGAGTANTRSQSIEAAGLSAAGVPQLELAWAFGFADASSARTQPTVLGGWLFTSGDNGEVFALDAKAGCTHWTFRARASVRTAMTVVPYESEGDERYAIYFGDGLANAYALDAQSGTLLWVREVDEHPNAVITGAPTVHEGIVYVPTSAAGEEVRGPGPDYGCCTFRGSVSALDANTGDVIWKTYSITEEPSPRGLSANGVQLYGPAGAGIWGSPTIDAERGVLYVGTGNGFADPVQPTSDAIIAMNLNTGEVAWVQQTLANDNWLWQCEAAANLGNPNCPATQGPDFDFATAPMLTTSQTGRELLVVPQKSGMVYALDPDAQGAIVWEYKIGEGSSLGGQWGAASDGQNVYVGRADTLAPEPGGMYALDLDSGEPSWFTPPQPTLCEGNAEQLCFAAQGGAVSVIPGIVFSGGSDGGLRAYSTEDGSIVWQYDTNREFTTVNGVNASGAAIDASGPVIVGGMLYINSGYNGIVGRAGNVLLAFRLQ